MKEKDENKKERFTIEELFLVKADWQRTFIGTLIRNIKGGVKSLCCKVEVNEGRIIGVAENDTELVEVMDTICILKLDHGLHEKQGPTFELSIGAINLN